MTAEEAKSCRHLTYSVFILLNIICFIVVCSINRSMFFNFST